VIDFKNARRKPEINALSYCIHLNTWSWNLLEGRYFFN